eukprot:UN07288
MTTFFLRSTSTNHYKRESLSAIGFISFLFSTRWSKIGDFCLTPSKCRFLDGRAT